MRFTWHDDKAKSNAKKHGVTFDEAATVFADPLAIVVEDAAHEERTIIIGQSARARLLFTVFVEFSDDDVRIISARRATPHERKKYEEGDSEQDSATVEGITSRHTRGRFRAGEDSAQPLRPSHRIAGCFDSGVTRPTKKGF